MPYGTISTEGKKGCIITQDKQKGGGVVERMLTVADVAELLQIHIQTARRWLQTGRIPGGVKVGDRGVSEWRIKMEDLEAWVDRQKQKAADE